MISKLGLAIWKKVRWVPGVFWISFKIYRKRFLKFAVDDRTIQSDFREKRRLCIVIPDNDLTSSSFQPLGGNIFFEVFESARERYGAEEVFLWSEELIHGDLGGFVNFLERKKITHIVMCPETPEPPDTWPLPALLNTVSSESAITFWFFLFDSVYWDHMFKLNHLSHFVGGYFALAIDRPISVKLSDRGRACKPVCLPISNRTLQSLPKVAQSYRYAERVSFLGSLYGYRAKAFKKLKPGVLSLNPHRLGSQKPNYEEYMMALWNSKATANFARASSYNLSQLKSRVLEAGVVGCPVISDDQGKGSRYLGGDALTFTVSRSGGIRRFLADPTSQRKLEVFDRQKLLERSRELAPKAFWESFENAELAWFSSK